MYYLLLLILISVLLVYFYPKLVLIPVNTILWYDNSFRTNFYNRDMIQKIFPTSNLLEFFWREIRGEILENLDINSTQNYLDNFYVDIGQEDKKDWATITFRIFGKDNVQNINSCPILGDIINVCPEIISCLVSIMEPGKIILPHYGPYDGLLRYQLPLVIPDSPNRCYLHVNGEKRNWVLGEGILFDESNIHGAVNDTPFKRIVLLIDIERPYSNCVLRLLNKSIISIMGILPGTVASVK